MPSKMFYLNPTVADTLSVMAPNPYQMPPGDWLIYRIRVAFANVVNAKENSGFIHVETSERSYDFAYGNGSGGATNSQSGPAEVIECAIHAEGNTNIQVYAYDSEAHIAEYVSLAFKPGGKNNYRTMAAGGSGGNGDTAALTEESFSVDAKVTRASLTPAQNGKIYRIRFAGTSIVDAKSSTGYIRLLITNQAGPFEYAIGSNAGGAATSGAMPTDVVEIPEGIPVSINSTLDIKITTLEICKTPVISLEYW